MVRGSKQKGAGGKFRRLPLICGDNQLLRFIVPARHYLLGLLVRIIPVDLGELAGVIEPAFGTTTAKACRARRALLATVVTALCAALTVGALRGAGLWNVRRLIITAWVVWSRMAGVTVRLLAGSKQNRRRSDRTVPDPADRVGPAGRSPADLVRIRPVDRSPAGLVRIRPAGHSLHRTVHKELDRIRGRPGSGHLGIHPDRRVLLDRRPSYG